LDIQDQGAGEAEAEVMSEAALTKVSMRGRMPLCAGLVTITHSTDTAGLRIGFGHTGLHNGGSVRGFAAVGGESSREWPFDFATGCGNAGPLSAER
jgi:hypothetical protein